MSLTRWTPFQDFDAVERRMRRFFDDAGISPAPLPPTDVYETEGEYVIELEVPGFAEKELAVEVSDHTLAIKGHRSQEKDEQDKAFRLHERLATEFERRFALPADADADKLGAEFKAGVLTVRAPKDKAAKPRTVAIAAK